MTRRGGTWSLARWLQVGASLPLLAGCSLATSLPAPTTLDERLAALPTEGLPVSGDTRILWNDRLVPYVVAERDDDAAFALGLVHAHLRLGQMMLARRIASGRLAEVAGPMAIDLDRTLRTLGIARAADAIVETMDPEARRWLERFTEGVNVYQARMTELPHEHQVLGVGAERWRPRDVVALGRLGGVDVTWGSWPALFALREEPGWSELWPRLLRRGRQSPTSFGADLDHAMAEGTRRARPLIDVLRAVARTGSNSVAVSARRSASGAPLVAHDPHLGLLLPNFWLIVGLRSPSYRVVGLMAPGVPVFALGRSPDLAWGGTNLYAATSELVDVSELDPASFAVEDEPLTVRFWPDRRARRRVTPHGPLLNDAPLFRVPAGRRLALRWIGHQVSDEVAAMLRTMRARSLEEARAALTGYALPALNWIVAERGGRIGHFLATRLPARPLEPPSDLWASPVEASRWWARVEDAATLPASIEPASGVLASANNRPTTAAAVPIGFFFGGPDRVLRLQELLASRERWSLAGLARIQRDTVSVSARDLAATLAERGLLPASLLGFDGDYRHDSTRALRFEAFAAALAPPVFRAAGRGDELAGLRASGAFKAELLVALESLDADTLVACVDVARDAARDPALAGVTWGDRHRLALAHPFARVPVFGRRYRRPAVAASGSYETLLKTAHPYTTERHTSDFGSQARALADLVDLDANAFTLLGGQDGWLGSAHFDDQLPLWGAGKSIAMPLREDTIAALFAHERRLRPDGAP